MLIKKKNTVVGSVATPLLGRWLDAYGRLSRCCVRIIFLKALSGCWREETMTDRVALLVKTRQDRQHNSVKHPEIVSLFVYINMYVYFE